MIDPVKCWRGKPQAVSFLTNDYSPVQEKLQPAIKYENEREWPTFERGSFREYRDGAFCRPFLVSDGVDFGAPRVGSHPVEEPGHAQTDSGAEEFPENGKNNASNREPEHDS